MPEESDEKTPWWMWPLLPLWLLLQVVSFAFVIAFTLWRVLLALTIPIVVIAVIVVLITGGGGGDGATSSQLTSQEASAVGVATVGLYCIYGSVDKAQYKGCLTHVSPEEVLHRHTDAAEYALGNRTTCGTDSGPACAPRDVILERMGIQKP